VIRNLNERNLRGIVSRIDWYEQRSMFHKIIGPRNQVAAMGPWVSPNLNLAAGGIKTLNRLVHDHRLE
jgi:hypothetical protein